MCAGALSLLKFEQVHASPWRCLMMRNHILIAAEQ